MSPLLKYSGLSAIVLFLFLCVPAGIMAEDNEDKPWGLGASVGLEFDDNLTRIEQDIVSGDSDHAYVFEAYGSYRFWERAGLELEAGYDFYQSLYDDRTDFDFQSHSFNISAAQDAGKLDFGADYSYIYTTLGGDDFLGLHLFIPRVGISITPKLYTDINYILQGKNFFEDDDRDAVNHSVGITQFLFFMESRAYVNAGFRLEVEDADGDEFDYFGPVLKLGVKLPGPWETIWKAAWKYQFRDYNDITPSIGEEREDKINTFQLSAVKPLAKILDLKLEYEHIASDSNLPVVDFSENIVTLTLAAHF